jgi:small subunit ribosomal protein S4
MERRPNPPGQHGATPRRKVSGYKKQLVEKQRLRAQYNMSERQMSNAFAEAIRQSGNTGVRCCAAVSCARSTRPGRR